MTCTHGHLGRWEAEFNCPVLSAVDRCVAGTLIVVHDTKACAGVEIAWLRATWEGIITPLAEFIGDQKPLGIGVGRVN